MSRWPVWAATPERASDTTGCSRLARGPRVPARPCLQVPLDCGQGGRAGSWCLGVSNGPGGYNFFGQEGTSPKSVGFGGLVPAPCQSCFFPRIDLTTLLIGLKMASAVGAHFTGQGPSGHCLVVKRAELPAGNSSRVHPRHLLGRDPPSVWFTLDEH